MQALPKSIALLENEDRLHIFPQDTRKVALDALRRHIKDVTASGSGPFVCILDIDGTCLRLHTQETMSDMLHCYHWIMMHARTLANPYCMQVHYLTARNGRDPAMVNLTVEQLRRSGFLLNDRERIYFCDHQRISSSTDIAAQKDTVRQRYARSMVATVGDSWGDILAPSALLAKLERDFGAPDEQRSFVLRKLPGMSDQVIGVKLTSD